MKILTQRGIPDVAVFILVILALIAFQPSVENADLVILPLVGIAVLRLLYLLSKNEIIFSLDVLNFENFRSAITTYFAFTVVAVLTLWMLQTYLVFPDWLKDDEVVTFLLVHALIQEIVFRTYLVSRLKLFITKPVPLALVSGLIFASAHAILPDAFVVVLLTFIAGTIWSYLYFKFPNLLFIVISHVIINIAINIVY